MPTRVKPLKVGVYRVRIQNQDRPAPPLADAVRAIQALPDDETRTMLIDAPIRPRGKIVGTDEYFLLDFNRIRQTDRIALADIRGVEGEIKFGPKDKKPSERTAVIIDAKSDTMCVQEHTWSIGHNLLARYFKAVMKVADVQSSIVLNEGGLDRLKDKRHHLLRVKLAGIENATALRASGKGDGAILKLLEEFRAPDATISLSIESDGESRLDKVIETASAIIGWNHLPELFGRKKPVKDVSVITDDEDEDMAVVHLLKDRMLHIEEIELEKGKEPTDDDRYRAVISAWRRHYAELRKRFPKA